MLDKKLADELTVIASEQLSAGLEAKEKRMKDLVKFRNLCNNKTIELDTSFMHIPFPIMAGQMDLLYSKIDNPPSLDFKLPNRKTLSEKIKAAWQQDMSSSRSGWRRKDRAEKRGILTDGRAVAKIYASSVNNEYQAHYDVVDIFSFVADPTRGRLEEGNYHGETDIFKTKDSLDAGIKAGIYDAAQVRLLSEPSETPKDGNQQVVSHKFDRLKALGIDVESTSFAGQKGFNLTEWIMRYKGLWYYLFFDPVKRIWVRADELKNVFENGKTPYVSWATNYEEYNFWSKGPADDVYPIAEAIRFILNNALENEKRRSRPMRTADAGALVDISELQDYVPDNIILTNPGRDPRIVTIETPDAQASINIAEFLDAMIQNKSGVSDPGITSQDPKVGVYYGKLQQEADRIGAINKEYSESYADKGYRYFWGLKQHLTSDKQIEMLGKGGVKLHQLSKIEFKDVDDVDDVIVTGGSQEQETTAVEAKQKNDVVTEVIAAFPQVINPRWAIKTKLKIAGFDDDDITEALDPKLSMDTEQIEMADQAIQSVLLDEDTEMFQGAETPFANRILDYARTQLDWVLLDSEGNEKGIDKKTKQQFDRLLKFVAAHGRIIADNMARKQQKAQSEAMLQQPQEGQPSQGMPTQESQTPPQNYQNLKLAQPGESLTPVAGTPSGTASQSQGITSAMTG